MNFFIAQNCILLNGVPLLGFFHPVIVCKSVRNEEKVCLGFPEKPEDTQLVTAYLRALAELVNHPLQISRSAPHGSQKVEEDMEHHPVFYPSFLLLTVTPKASEMYA